MLVFSLGACALALLATMCIVCHRKRRRRRRRHVNMSRDRRPFAPPGLESSRPSLSLPSEVPAPPASFFGNSQFLPPLKAADSGELHNV